MHGAVAATLPFGRLESDFPEGQAEPSNLARNGSGLPVFFATIGLQLPQQPEDAEEEACDDSQSAHGRCSRRIATDGFASESSSRTRSQCGARAARLAGRSMG